MLEADGNWDGRVNSKLALRPLLRRVKMWCRSPLGAYLYLFENVKPLSCQCLKINLQTFVSMLQVNSVSWAKFSATKNALAATKPGRFGL